MQHCARSEVRLPCRRRADEDVAVCMRALGKRVRLLRVTAERTQQEPE
jgi:hypothetical protein